MKPPSSIPSLMMRKRPASFFPLTHAILPIDLSLLLNLLLFSALMSRVNRCLFQHQCLPFRLCLRPSCPPPLLQIRDALASSSNSLIFLHFPPFLSPSPYPKSHSLCQMEAVLRSAVTITLQESLPSLTNFFRSQFIFFLPHRCLTPCLVSLH